MPFKLVHLRPRDIIPEFKSGDGDAVDQLEKVISLTLTFIPHSLDAIPLSFDSGGRCVLFLVEWIGKLLCHFLALQNLLYSLSIKVLVQYGRRPEMGETKVSSVPTNATQAVNERSKSKNLISSNS